DESGGLRGDNTDVEGFLALVEAAGVALKGDGGLKVALLGAGGAARAAVQALSPHASLILLNRTLERAHQLERDFEGTARFIAVTGTATAELLRDCDLLGNTTSVGMERAGVDPDESPVPADALPDAGVVIDMVYRPE